MSLVSLVSNRAGLALDRLLVRWTGRSLIGRVYARAAGIESLPCLLLTTVGSRTGRRRTAVLPYTREGRDLLLVGSNGGAAVDPRWVGNLRANPGAWVRVNRRRVAVSARVARGEERARLWQSITQGRGPYARYQEMARPREIPVVVLSPFAPGPDGNGV